MAKVSGNQIENVSNGNKTERTSFYATSSDFLSIIARTRLRRTNIFPRTLRREGGVKLGAQGSLGLDRVQFSSFDVWPLFYRSRQRRRPSPPAFNSRRMWTLSWISSGPPLFATGAVKPEQFSIEDDGTNGHPLFIDTPHYRFNCCPDRGGGWRAPERGISFFYDLLAALVGAPIA